MNNTVKTLEHIKALSDKIMENPGSLSMDRESFRYFYEKWKAKQSILEVWDDIDNVFFPINLENDLFVQLSCLLRNNINNYIDILADWHNPLFIYQKLWYDVKDWNILIKMLRIAPSCSDVWGSSFDWNGIAFTPVVLDLLMTKLKPSNRVELNAEEFNKKLFEILSILKDRSDGFFLAYYYTEYLMKQILSREIDKIDETYENICTAIGTCFHDSAEYNFSEHRYFDSSSLLVSKPDEVKDDFRHFGVLSEVKKERDILVSFLTRMLFLQTVNTEDLDDPKRCLDDFCCVLATNSWSFYTQDFKIYLKHIKVADIFLAQEDVVKAWKTMYKYMTMARNRTAACYYGNASMDLRYRFNFMCSVGLKILDIQINGEERNTAMLFWRELWEEAVDYARRFAAFHDDFTERYLCLLIVYRFILAKHADEKQNSAEILMNTMREIRNFPHTVTMSVMFLEDNKFSSKEFFEGQNKEENIAFFKNLFSLVVDELRDISYESKLFNYAQHKLRELTKAID